MSTGGKGSWLVVGGVLTAGLGLGGCATSDAGLDPPDASCPDTDADGACDAEDVCPRFDDRTDTDTDTVPDGCDRCAGEDDRVDLNANQEPDCTELLTRTIDLKVVDGNLWRGWHSSVGGHDTTNENTLTGVLGTSSYSSYFVFALTGFTGSVITAITLELQLESYASADPSETFSVWDVSAGSSAIETTANDPALYADLHTGAMYATTTVTAAQVTSTLSIPLGAQAALDASAKLGGDFVVGLNLDTAPGWIRFGNTPAEATPIIARVTFTYLP